MSEKKPAQQHLQAVHQVMAQFDIETYVKRVTLETMDSFMLGNKQAFTYIQEWESKFIGFQSRLMKAETVCFNMEKNLSNKIQVSNQAYQQLNKFSDEFYTSLKASQESLEQVRRNYSNLLRETGNQAASLRAIQREIAESNRKIMSFQSHLKQQNTNLHEKIQQTTKKLIFNNNERRSEVQDILLKLSQAKSELDSKTERLSELCNDLVLYQNQKSQLHSQIDNLYSEISARVLTSDFNKIRLYVDGIQKRGHEQLLQIQKQIKSENKKLEKETRDKFLQVEQKSLIIEKKINESVQRLQKEAKIINQNTIKRIIISEQKIQSNFNILNKKCQQESENSKQLFAFTQTLEQKQSVFHLQSQQDFKNHSDHINEAEGNILSINNKIKSMQNQNVQRGQQLMKLQVDSTGKGDINAQVQRIAQKVLGHDQQIIKNAQKIEELNGIVGESFIRVQSKIQKAEKINRQQFSIIKETQKNDFQNTNTKINEIHTLMKTKIELNYSQTLKIIDKSLEQSIGKIKQKFDFLTNLSKQMQVFKNTFEQQLQMNDNLNKQVKQKMQRIFTMFTKMKSDAFLRIQTVSQDQIKLGNGQKQIHKKIGDYASEIGYLNEITNILLCLSMWKQFLDDNESPEQYKILSMIQGFVLDISKNSGKYRTQLITRKTLSQLVLQYHIKHGDKIKGNLIENGKQIWAKISGGNNEQLQILRRKSRSISRKKHRQSELPKVHK